MVWATGSRLALELIGELGQVEEGTRQMGMNISATIVENLVALVKPRILETGSTREACNTTSLLLKIIFIRVLLVLLEMPQS